MVLIGVGTAIKDGDTTVDSAFRKVKDATAQVLTAEELQILLDDVMPELTKAEKEDAERIIEKNETNVSANSKLLKSKLKE